MGKTNKLTILAALIVAGTFTGCGNKTAEQSESVAEEQQASVLKEKESGTKNELTAGELAYFNKELNGEYKILGQLGRSGQHSSAYLMENANGEKYVLKIPNSEGQAPDWAQGQSKVIDSLKNLSDYQGNCNIPQYIKLGNNYVVEKYLGEDLTQEVYDSLSEEEKDGIAKAIVDFLVYLHAKHSQGDKAQLDVNNNIDEILEHIKPLQTEKEQKDLAAKIELFKNKDTSDEVCVLVHNDVRNQNLLYDKETRKVALIDFENMRDANIYCDFVPGAAASFGLDYGMLFKMINYYNAVSEYKVSSEKIKLLHELGIWDEYVRVSILEGNKYIREDVYESVKEKIKMLNDAYGRNDK